MHRLARTLTSLILLSLTQLPLTALANDKIVYMQAPNDKGPFTIMIGEVVAKDGKPQVDAKPFKEGVYPSISADGQTIAYLEGPAWQYQIVTANVVTGEKKTWTKDAGANFHPDISGNGRYLAYSAPVGPEVTEKLDGKDVTRKHNQIVVVDMEGKVATETIESEGDAYFPKLSSDGRLVVFHISKKDGGETKRASWKGVVVYDRLKKKATSLTTDKEYCYEPGLSFDDRWVSVSCYSKWPLAADETPNDDIYVLELANPTAPRKLVTNSPVRELYSAFRRDGSIVFTSRQDKNEELFLATPTSNPETPYTIAPLVRGEGIHYSTSFTGSLALRQQHRPGALVQGRSSFACARDQENLFVLGGQVMGAHEREKNAITDSLECVTADKAKGNLPPRPTAAEGFGMAIDNQRIFAFGGLVADSADGAVESHSIDAIDMFDLQNKTWTTLPVHLSRPRSSFTPVKLGRRVYILGGWHYTPEFAAAHDDEGEYLDSIEVFDLDTLTLSMHPLKMHAPKRRAFAAAAYGNKLILAGGMAGGDVGFLNNVTVFDPQAATAESAWQDLPPLPLRSFAPAAGVVDNVLYAMGGYAVYYWSTEAGKPPKVRISNHIFALDLQNEVLRWQHTGRYMKESRSFFAVDPNPDTDSLDIIGGQSGSGNIAESLSTSRETIFVQ